MKKTYLSIAAVAAISMAAVTAGFAAELPTYETKGFPISPVQAGLLGAANAQQQPPVSTAAASPHQLSVLAPRQKLKTATAARSGTASGVATR